MEKYQTSGRLVIRRPCSVVSEEKKVSRLDSSYSVSAKWTRLRIVNEGRILSKENWYISKRNIALL